jgi:DNA (cytosine-5)-methyltransferase 1
LIRVLDLFSGIGGFSLGLERTGGFKTVAFCEIDQFCRDLLMKRFPGVPVYGDIRSLSAEKLAADGIRVDAICGGFPCTDLSRAGPQTGLNGSRSGLWFEYARLIGELRPDNVIVENVPDLLGNGMDRLLSSLSEVGYDAEWSIISACSLGASHPRERLWIVAYPIGSNVEGLDFSQSICIDQEKSQRREFARAIDAALPADDYARMRGDHNDVSTVMDRLKALGNAVVPQIPEMIGRAILASRPRIGLFD